MGLGIRISLGTLEHALFWFHFGSQEDTSFHIIYYHFYQLLNSPCVYMFLHVAYLSNYLCILRQEFELINLLCFISYCLYHLLLTSGF